MSKNATQWVDEDGNDTAVAATEESLVNEDAEVLVNEDAEELIVSGSTITDKARTVWND